MMEIWPLGPGDEVLGQPVMERRLHSVRTAAQATGVDQRRLRKMLAVAGIVPEPEAGLPDSWEVFEASKAKGILDDLTTLVPAKTFAVLIGASRSQFDLLVRDGVLIPALESGDVEAVWNPADAVAFLDGLFTRAVPISAAQHGWEHLSKSAQRLKIGPGEILRPSGLVGSPVLPSKLIMKAMPRFILITPRSLGCLEWNPRKRRASSFSPSRWDCCRQAG